MATAATLPQTNLGKGLRALVHCLRHPGFAARTFGSGLAALYRDSVAERSPLPVRTLQELVPRETAVTLADCHGRTGNVSLHELVAIASLVSHRQPRVVVEIGTFDGNTTLQMAANAPADARVFTLDLPPSGACAGELDPQDAAYIADPTRQRRKFLGTPHAAKIAQWLGDSATFDFAAALDGRRVDFAFVDGSHGYDYVRSDTERLRLLLADDAVVLWHDYTPVWPGVIRWLDELSRELPLVRIAGTNLVCCDFAAARR